MTTEYKMEAFDRTGAKVSVLTGKGENAFLDLNYVKEVNAPGFCEWRLNADHPMISDLARDYQINISRRNPAMGLTDWYVDFRGLYRYLRYELLETGREVAILHAPGLLHFLARRWILWYADTTDRSNFDGVDEETLIKDIVYYNLGAGATLANGRVELDGTMPNLTVEADGGGGGAVDRACAWQNALNICQNVANAGTGDIDIVATTEGLNYEFKWYAGQRGDDVSDSVLFSPKRGNMERAIYTVDRMEEITAVVTGGQGQETDRDMGSAISAEHSATNKFEKFADSRNYTWDQLDSHAEDELIKLSKTQTLAFRPKQTPATVYNVHYNFGDIVRGAYRDFIANFKIAKVGVNLSPDRNEELTFELKQVT